MKTELEKEIIKGAIEYCKLNDINFNKYDEQIILNAIREVSKHYEEEIKSDGVILLGLRSKIDRMEEQLEEKTTLLEACEKHNEILKDIIHKQNMDSMPKPLKTAKEIEDKAKEIYPSQVDNDVHRRQSFIRACNWMQEDQVNECLSKKYDFDTVWNATEYKKNSNSNESALQKEDLYFLQFNHGKPFNTFDEAAKSGIARMAKNEIIYITKAISKIEVGEPTITKL